jgi:AraC-like DNA-binding protein
MIPQYTFYKTKYGDELLIDVVPLEKIKKYTVAQPVHTLTYYDITLITEGAGTFHIDDRTRQVNAGDIIFSRPGEIRQWDSSGIRQGYALIFEEEFLVSFFNDPDFLLNLSYFHIERPHPFLPLEESTHTRIRELILTIQKEVQTDETKDKHLLRAFLYEALMLLNRFYKEMYFEENSSTEIKKQHISKFVRLVNESFKENRSIRNYAAELCITPNYLNEIVKETVGISAKHYILNKVLLEAKKLLLYTNLSIVEIADRLHYESSSYFIRFFHMHTRQTPLEYRRNAKP